MDLRILWFILISVLYIGYFVLEGFDLGVGMLLPFIAKSDTKRRMVINTIGPHWDGNEVWLITAGGATFAAFPHWYATLFSGFYLPLFLMLVGLILRGVALEFRSKDENPLWRSFWDWATSIGSFLPALLWGVALANFLRGVPIDSAMQYTGGFWNLLNPFALLGGLISVLAFLVHGALFLTLKLQGDGIDKSRVIAKKFLRPLTIIFFGTAIYNYFATDVSTHSVIPLILSGVALITLLIAGQMIGQKKDGWAFAMTSTSIAVAIAGVFTQLFPRVLISSTNPEWSLTVFNAASGDVTLQLMTKVVLFALPVVLAYQFWSYWIFRKRVSQNPQELEY
ncbi:MAG: cytochrome d ubiquinol oxidase subunit II [Anaerolineaceae bacterium]|nr:cytochrome d ubiquinol oxidase subunit II [Anaerolineaceae bacterium]